MNGRKESRKKKGWSKRGK